jgi:hypothetical protein
LTRREQSSRVETMDVALLFEWEIDADGNAQSTLWEWK